jgi:hypothetical protein
MDGGRITVDHQIMGDVPAWPVPASRLPRSSASQANGLTTNEIVAEYPQLALANVQARLRARGTRNGGVWQSVSIAWTGYKTVWTSAGSPSGATALTTSISKITTKIDQSSAAARLGPSRRPPGRAVPNDLHDDLPVRHRTAQPDRATPNRAPKDGT